MEKDKTENGKTAELQGGFMSYEEFFNNILGIHQNVKGFTDLFESNNRNELQFEISGTKYRVVYFTDDKPYSKYIVSVKHSGEWWRVKEEDLKAVFDLFFKMVTKESELPEYTAGIH